MAILMIDPVGGISGDMLLASLIHLGCPADYLKKILEELPMGTFDLRLTPGSINGIGCIGLSFETGPSDHERTFSHIRDDILAALPSSIRERATAIFTALAEVEADVHGTQVDEVHFHEVGATDSIFDIVGISAALEWFGSPELYVRTIPLGSGTVQSRHGRIPVPAPATIRLLEGMKVAFTPIEGELTTPTGAAVIKALCSNSPPPPDLVVKAVGYGCGQKRYGDWPNFCRTILCEYPEEEHVSPMYAVEADIDDMRPEDFEAALARITEAGALDVSLTHKIMKRGRPGVGVQALCSAHCLHRVLDAVLCYTTSIGARYYPIQRSVLHRRESTLATRFGAVRIKEVETPQGDWRAKPEYSDLHKISMKHNVPLSELRAEIDALLAQIEEEKHEA
ncbi:MAG: nickel pincer cofactor biosynthesis protein LarC [Desulfomonilia bacterium]|nr:nickel pincer cofactor biosynthesis protein LarC [Desulfomonilia bacterium]